MIWDGMGFGIGIRIEIRIRIWTWIVRHVRMGIQALGKRTMVLVLSSFCSSVLPREYVQRRGAATQVREPLPKRTRSS